MADDAEFQSILMNTLKLEGGYTVDNGKPTNRGVRQDVYDAYAKANKLESKSVKELTHGDVSDFYKKEYYDKAVKDIPSRNIKGMVFDYAVNAGVSKAVSDLQSIVGTKADGIAGKKTKAAIEKYLKKNGEDALKTELTGRRVQHYQNLVIANPEKYQKYEKGWFNRMESLLRTYKSGE